jgi:hypothetical protein
VSASPPLTFFRCSGSNLFLHLQKVSPDHSFASFWFPELSLLLSPVGQYTLLVRFPFCVDPLRASQNVSAPRLFFFGVLTCPSSVLSSLCVPIFCSNYFDALTCPSLRASQNVSAPCSPFFGVLTYPSLCALQLVRANFLLALFPDLSLTLCSPVCTYRSFARFLLVYRLIPSRPLSRL